MTHKLIIFLFLLGTQGLGSAQAIEQKPLTKKQFLNIVFEQRISQVKTQKLWLDKELQSQVHQILDHNYPKLRLTYKILESVKQQQSVWFLDEIGKEKQITFGVSIINDRVDLIRVLTFRESRGGEIQMQAFSQQFDQAGLTQGNLLDLNIDGISGATMSVTAMKKIARLALILHKTVLAQESSE